PGSGRGYGPDDLCTDRARLGVGFGKGAAMTQVGASDQMTHQEAANDRALFGFWIYLMTDLLMFAVLFAVYAVLHGNTAGGPTGRDLFRPPLALAETLILLASSFSCGLAMIAARRGLKRQTIL